MLGASFGILTGMHFYFKIDNRKRIRGDYDHRIEGKTEEEANEMGEHNPRYLWSI